MRIRSCENPFGQNHIWGFVGDGFIRPEVTSFCVNGCYPSPTSARSSIWDGQRPINLGRGNLGADKSAPYETLQIPLAQWFNK
ncbi:MAG: hypothetical protein FWG87_08155 [Defluviitaleaceae bacterium]|nr:hypothetical protein [Defluviitaleaceae bacterium]